MLADVLEVKYTQLVRRKKKDEWEFHSLISISGFKKVTKKKYDVLQTKQTEGAIQKKKKKWSA